MLDERHSHLWGQASVICCSYEDGTFRRVADSRRPCRHWAEDATASAVPFVRLPAAVLDRVVRTRQVVHIVDVAAEHISNPD